MHKRPLIAANWKMHPPPAGFDASDSPYRSAPGVDVVVFPTFLHVHACIDAGLVTGGQCGHPDADGAHTGDVAMAMLREAGCHYVLCGHSERRRDHEEGDEAVWKQASAALQAGLRPILCVGETWDQRETGMTKDVVRVQLARLADALRSPLPGVPAVAYEPVWAIGSGRNAKPEDVRDMHAFIRETLGDAGAAVPILYGGSLNAGNAETLLRQPHVDGGLIGGCSLKPAEFRTVVQIAASVAA
jgi:triosephosphate isomerase